MKRALLLALCVLLPACAHKAPLKTPTEAAKDQLKKDKTAANRAKREAEKLQKQSQEKTPENSQEVTVPEVAH